MEIKVSIHLLVRRYFFANHKSENTPPAKRATRSTRGQGGRIDQMQKTFDAITRKDKRKKPALTDIPDNMSHNPMAIPEKTNRKANKVFGD